MIRVMLLLEVQFAWSGTIKCEHMGNTENGWGTCCSYVQASHDFGCNHFIRSLVCCRY